MRPRQATRTRTPVAKRPPNPCDHCVAGDEHMCTGVNCYRCPNHHRKYGVIAAAHRGPYVPKSGGYRYR